MQITPHDLVSLRTANVAFTFLDVRELSEVALAAIPGCLHIPLRTLAQEFTRLKKDTKIVILCHHGKRSLNACLFLREQGYNDVVSLAGGIDAWAKEVDSTIPLY